MNLVAAIYVIPWHGQLVRWWRSSYPIQTTGRSILTLRSLNHIWEDMFSSEIHLHLPYWVTQQTSLRWRAHRFICSDETYTCIALAAVPTCSHTRYRPLRHFVPQSAQSGVSRRPQCRKFKEMTTWNTSIGIAVGIKSVRQSFSKDLPRFLSLWNKSSRLCIAPAT